MTNANCNKYIHLFKKKRDHFPSWNWETKEEKWSTKFKYENKTKHKFTDVRLELEEIKHEKRPSVPFFVCEWKTKHGKRSWTAGAMSSLTAFEDLLQAPHLPTQFYTPPLGRRGTYLSSAILKPTSERGVPNGRGFDIVVAGLMSLVERYLI